MPQSFLEVAATLNDKELALLVRRQTGKDPNGMSKEQALEALGSVPAPEDHARLVGEVQQQLEAAEQNSADTIVDIPGRPGRSEPPSDSQVYTPLAI